MIRRTPAARRPSRSMRLPLCLSFVAVFSAVARGEEPTPAADASLKEAYREDFAIGVALGGNVPGGYTDEELALVRRHFAVVTPENAMKMGHVQRAEGKFDFEQADLLVEFAKRNGLGVVGHTLVWARDDATPVWIFEDAGGPADRELLLRRMREHIQAVAGRYRGDAAEWDVVNEAIVDGEDGYLRPSKWLEIAGPDFIAEAFKAAHAAAPEAVLIYNDYGTEKPAKRERMVRLLRELLEKGAPVHAVGLQGHFELDQVPMKELEETLVAIKGLGLKAMVTELDIATVPRGRWWADDGKHRAEMEAWDPYREGCPPEILARQAEQYGELFRLFRRHADVIERVTFWDLHDGRSWLNDFPWKHVEHPLLFDRDARPKPALGAVLAAADAKGSSDEDLAEAVALILDDAVPQERREELIARHKADSARLLWGLTDGLAPGTPEEIRRIPWIWRVAVAAGRRNDDAELAAVLDASLPAPGGRLLEWQAVAVGGGIVNGVGLVGAWPSERIDAVLKDRLELRERWATALNRAVAMSDDEKVIPGTRYDALRMVSLADWQVARPVLERYLGHENGELQQGAVSGLADVRNAEAPRLLLGSLGGLTEGNRDFALDALVRDADRMRLTLDALESGMLKGEDLGEARLRRLRESDDPEVSERAARLP